MLKQALLAFGTDPHREMPPIQRLRRFLAFLHADGRQHRNDRFWSDGTNHGTLFHLEQHLRKLFRDLHVIQPPFSSNKKRNFKTSRKCWLFCTKSDIFTQPKVYDVKTKSLMCQNGLFTICKSLVPDVLDMSKSTRTYCWSHLLTNSGKLVAHIIFWKNLLWKKKRRLHLILNDVNSESKVDKLNMVEFRYHGEWYTLLIIDMIDCKWFGKISK